MAVARSFRELDVYRRAFDAAMEVHRLSQTFPKEEQYAPTDQVRRSSRFVCANIAEAWRKRRYVRAFTSKLSDADSEAAETLVWLEFALHLNFVDAPTYKRLADTYDHAGAQLTNMITHANDWCPNHA
ncbi:MAG: four helix bundle protein [Phycisphaeraceae bacterium]